MIIYYVISAVAICLLLMCSLMAWADRQDGLGLGLFTCAMIWAMATGVILLVTYEPPVERDYQLLCVDGNAAVVDEVWCEKETRPGAFWLWIGTPVTPVPAERAPAPTSGVLVDCTDGGVWEQLGLDAEDAALPPNGTVRQADEDVLRNLGVIR